MSSKLKCSHSGSIVRGTSISTGASVTDGTIPSSTSAVGSRLKKPCGTQLIEAWCECSCIVAQSTTNLACELLAFLSKGSWTLLSILRFYVPMEGLWMLELIRPS